jgi:hypothetical protein
MRTMLFVPISNAYPCGRAEFKFEDARLVLLD